MNNDFKKAIKSSVKSLYNSLPVIVGVVLLISIVNVLIPKSFYLKIFNKSNLLDLFIGSSLGSIFAGNPITSYMLGGELLKEGIGLLAVTSFIVAWVTVGLVQLPAEIIMLGKKFAILRNVISFIFSILVATVTVSIINNL
jgi:uncharacterized membrane protein YraQ (UPF0718 family)